MFNHISHADDPRLDDVRNLKHSDVRPDLPGGKGLVIAEGPLVIERLLASRCEVRTLVGFPAKLEKFLAQPHIQELLANNPGIAIHSVDRDTLGAAVGYDMHRGLLAAANRPQALSIEEAIAGARTVAVLEGVGDHENIGSMFRNGAGMGVDAVLFGNGCADPLYRRVVRVSMGHVLNTPFAHFEGKPWTWQQQLETLRDNGFYLVALTPNPEVELLPHALAHQPEKVALLIGAEGPGLSEKAMRACDTRARIPMAPGTDSLNLATAAAIAFYERDRQAYVG